ncbi:MAG: HD domain-containing protein [Actinomycetia bacterium]|nr:HD domain-containing protein [Actinomycetes bacterium]
MWRNLRDATQEDVDEVVKGYSENAADLADHLISHLELLKGEKGGFTIDRYDHSLQTATRAYRDGKDEEYVVCALLHDVGDLLAPYNHGEMVAAMLRPFINDANHWMIKHHTVFQGYYFWDKIGQDKNARDKYKGEPYYAHTIEFCDKYDSAAFDPDYKSEPIEFFKPMVQNLVKNPKVRDF